MMKEETFILEAGDTVTIDGQVWRLLKPQRDIGILVDGDISIIPAGEDGPDGYESWVATPLDFDQEYHYLVVKAPGQFHGYCDLVACEPSYTDRGPDDFLDDVFDLEAFQHIHPDDISRSLDPDIAAFLMSV